MPNVVVHSSNSSMWEAEAGGVRIQPGLCSEFKASRCSKSNTLYQQNKIQKHGVGERPVKVGND